MLGKWCRENTTAHARLHSFFAQGLSHLEIEGATPSTANPQPSTLNPKPETLNPQPSTLIPNP